MATLHLTEAELVVNPAAILDKVREGNEIIVEQNHHPIAVIKPPQG